jgi:hypothetical protein
MWANFYPSNSFTINKTLNKVILTSKFQWNDSDATNKVTDGEDINGGYQVVMPCHLQVVTYVLPRCR